MPFPLPPSNIPKRNLVLTFDAFGTLFTPKSPISKQYIAAAREHGLNLTDEDEWKVMINFKNGTKSL